MTIDKLQPVCKEADLTRHFPDRTERATWRMWTTPATS